MPHRQAESLQSQPSGHFLAKTVIVAFEKEVTRAKVASPLRRSGYHVLEMKDGVELIDHLEHVFGSGKLHPTPDAIIADAQLYGYSGVEVCWALRKFSPNLPFLIVLRSKDQIDWQELADAGASYVGAEPINPAVLNDVVARLCVEGRG